LLSIGITRKGSRSKRQMVRTPPKSIRPALSWRRGFVGSLFLDCELCIRRDWILRHCQVVVIEKRTKCLSCCEVLPTKRDGWKYPCACARGRFRQLGIERNTQVSLC